MLLTGLAKRSASRLSEFMFIQNSLVGHFSSHTIQKICVCGATIPDVERIITLFEERRLFLLRNEVKCKCFHVFDFKQRLGCALTSQVAKTADHILPRFEDVIYEEGESVVFLEALNEVPKGDLVDSTGDYGKELIIFLNDCLSKNLLLEIGSIIDIGGQNNATVNLISELMKRSLPSLIIDINRVTPGVSPKKPHIKYAIGDAYSFFSHSHYHDLIKNVVNEKPTLCIFNNLLNVLPPEEGWELLETVWSKLRSKDYLVVSGLLPEQFKRLKRHSEKDGIAEFYNNQQFYKSALLTEFSSFLTKNLKNSSILAKENFTRISTSQSMYMIETKGHRVLVLKKD